MILEKFSFYVIIKMKMRIADFKLLYIEEEFHQDIFHENKFQENIIKKNRRKNEKQI